MALDTRYRQLVRSAAGDEYVDLMTEKCLSSVEALVRKDMPAGPASEHLVREIHRLAGGTAAVGLAALAACLRSLEEACRSAADASSLQQLWVACRASAQEARCALAGEGS